MAVLAVYLPVLWAAPASTARLLLQLVLIFTGLVVGARLARAGVRKAIWRLRNRLIVVYLFIAVVPVALILVLAGIGCYVLAGQIAVYLVTNEIERRTEALVAPAQGLLATPPEDRANRIRWLAPYYAERYPGLELLVRDGAEWRFPEKAAISAPAAGFPEADGLVLKDGRPYLWAHAAGGSAEAVLMAPLSRNVLATLVPNLGEVALLTRQGQPGGKEGSGDVRGGRIPPPANRFDFGIRWFSPVSVAVWNGSTRTQEAVMAVHSRLSAVLRTVFGQRPDWTSLWFVVFLTVGSLFVTVELVSWVIGVSMTRTITGAVHSLYQGTERIMRGDFAHRIEVRGADQLAGLGRSFNRMTETLERLLRVEKEKERLQAELAIAREVQNQLYPKSVPSFPGLDLVARCNPARMVSGDYYDYVGLSGSKVALAIGDVAGKGISAALLMASVQSSLRTQLRACLEESVSGRLTSGSFFPTARLVSQLNQHLYAYTSAEKFATFYFSIYDDETGLLTYTNAGHPPPIVIRNGEALRLETNGMVVGAFPTAEYGESRISLTPGDLLVCFTDGVTEPENEYGEMYGEERLIELLLKHSDGKTGDIIETVLASVEQWTVSPEAQDDMTMLVARRL